MLFCRLKRKGQIGYVEKKQAYYHRVCLKNKQSHENQESLRQGPKQKLTQTDGSVATQPRLMGEWFNNLTCERLDTQSNLSHVRLSTVSFDTISMCGPCETLPPATSKVKHLSICAPPLPPPQDTKGNIWPKVAAPYEKESKYLMFVLSCLYGRWQVFAV